MSAHDHPRLEIARGSFKLVQKRPFTLSVATKTFPVLQ